MRYIILNTIVWSMLITIATSEFSLEFIKKIGSIKSEEEFYKLSSNYNTSLEEDTVANETRKTVKASRTRSGTKADVPVVFADSCSIRKSTVSIPQPAEPDLFHWPVCTRLDRCGGCLPLEKYECAPSKTKMINIGVHVAKTGLENSGFYTIIRTKVIPIEIHVECEARCKVQSSHCSKWQKYVPQKCECECRRAPEQCFRRQHWDWKLCRCICDKIDICNSTKYHFDLNTCQCEQRILVFRGKGKSTIDLNVLREEKNQTKTSKKSNIDELYSEYSKGNIKAKKVLPYIPKETTAKPKSVDCSNKQCPPFFKPYPDLSGACTCKPGLL